VTTEPGETEPGEAAFPTLFSPIRIGPAEVRNRIVITAHGTSEAFRHPGMSPASYIEYLRRRAAGGAGLIICQPILSDPLLASRRRPSTGTGGWSKRCAQKARGSCCK
jgi:2,4-dienoyl-CoA reductase-like NADH-dependent reductase (Old Yellow Enzyme family)